MKPINKHDIEFLKMVDEFMEDNDELLRRLKDDMSALKSRQVMVVGVLAFRAIGNLIDRLEDSQEFVIEATDRKDDDSSE